MKILIIAGQELFPANSGGRRAIVLEAEALAAAGHEVSLLASCSVPPDGPLQDRYRDIFIHSAFVRRTSFLAATVRSPLTPYQFSSRSALDAAVWWRSGGVGPDVIVAHQEWTVPVARSIGVASGAPVVLRSHNDERAYFRLLAENGPLPARTYRYFEFLRMRRFVERCAPLADQIWTMSPGDAVAYRAHRSVANVEPVLGHEPDATTPTRQGNRVLSFFGALDMPHNVAGLRWFVHQVLPLVVAQVPDARLVIGGRGASDRLRLELSSAYAVDFVGEVQDPRAFIRGSDCFVNPIFVGSGVNIKVGDPMFAGVPIVSTSCGVRGLQAVSECVDSTDSVNEFAELCSRLILDPAAWGARATALYACRSQYSDRSFVRQAEARLAELVATSAAR